MGLDAATEALRWGVNDLGGTLMEENISRLAGSYHGVAPRPGRPDRRRAPRRPPGRRAHDALRDPPPLRARGSPRNGGAASSARCCATRARRTRRSGSRPTRRARSRCSAARARTFCVAGPPLRARARRGARAGHDHALRGRARRRAGLAAARQPVPAERRSARRDADGRTRIAFGSCRVCRAARAAVHAAQGRGPRRPRGRRAARARACGWRAATPTRSGRTCCCCSATRSTPTRSRRTLREFIRSRRDPEVPPGETVADFEEYTRLYRESWGEPHIRWLLSTVPTAMIFDDHDVHDDWNTSIDLGRARCAATGWWDDRIVGGFMSYWIYQHLGNLSPRELRRGRACTRSVREADDAARRSCASSPSRADREVEGTRWSYCRDIGRRALVMIDSRAGRVLEPGRALDARRGRVAAGSSEHAQRRRRPPADRHLAAVAAARRRCTTSRPGTRRCATAPGAARCARWGEKMRQGARPRALGRVRRLASSG